MYSISIRGCHNRPYQADSLTILRYIQDISYNINSILLQKIENTDNEKYWVNKARNVAKYYHEIRATPRYSNPILYAHCVTILTIRKIPTIPESRAAQLKDRIQYFSFSVRTFSALQPKAVKYVSKRGNAEEFKLLRIYVLWTSLESLEEAKTIKMSA